MTSTAEKRPQKRVRSRRDPRREATRREILEKAEELFGRFGIDAVSMRKIGSAIGSSNPNVVHYYFGNKEGLVLEIFRHRIPELEARRAELFTIACQDVEELDVYTLIDILWRPLYDIRDKDGRHAFAAYLASLSNSAWADMPLWTDVRGFIDTDYPVTSEIHNRLEKHLPKRIRPYYNQRLRVVTLIVTNTLRSLDQAPNSDQEFALNQFQDALRMAAAAMSAPA